MAGDALYQYSQLGCISAFILYSVCLLAIPIKSEPSSQLMRRARLLLVCVFLMFSVTTSIQSFSAVVDLYPLMAMSIDIMALYLATIMIGVAFVPFINRTHVTPQRLRQTIIIFLADVLVMAVGVVFNSKWVLMVASVVFLIELLRIISVFFTSFSRVYYQDMDVTSTAARGIYRWMLRSAVGLSVLAVLCPFVVFMPLSTDSIFNILAIAVWGYVFIWFVNFVILYRDGLVEQQSKPTRPTTVMHPQLQPLVERWVAGNHYRKAGVTLVAAAAAMETNRSYLSQYINSRFGCNFNTWLSQLRIEDAKRQMLSSPELSLEQLASLEGFSSKSHFMRTFKAQAGITPGQWRAIYLNS